MLIFYKRYNNTPSKMIELSDVQCTAKLQDVLNLIDMWAADWQLQISVTKTNILNIGSTEHAVDYYMDYTILPVVTTCRDLDITVTNDLAPSKHINDTTVKAHGVLIIFCIVLLLKTQECFYEHVCPILHCVSKKIHVTTSSTIT